MTPPPPTIHMTPEDLYAWRIGQNLSKRQAAAQLGVARNTFRSYETGKYPIPRAIWLACQMLTASKIAA
jgi:DNA-binding XRE family transcriptional regulator